MQTTSNISKTHSSRIIYGPRIHLSMFNVDDILYFRPNIQDGKIGKYYKVTKVREYSIICDILEEESDGKTMMNHGWTEIPFGSYGSYVPKWYMEMHYPQYLI